MKSLALKTSAFLEHFLIQALLYFFLLPLKFIYRAPQPTWNAWFANQKLCQLDGRYCWDSPGDQPKNPTTEQRRIDMTSSAPQTTPQDHSSELLEHLIAEEISLQVQNIAEGLQREGWPMALVKRFMHVAVEELPEWWLSAAELSSGTLEGCGSFDWVGPRTDQALVICCSISMYNPVFAAVITTTAQEKCDVPIMSPIFRCLGCGQYIERSLATFKKYKGQIFCSTCNDQRQIDDPPCSKKP